MAGLGEPCATGAECDAGTCASSICVPDAPTCVDDMTLVTPSGERVSCGDVPCVDGRCADACASDEDCAQGWVCDQEARECVGGPDLVGFRRVGTDESCGCRVPGDARSEGGVAGALLVATLFAVRRRRRGAAPLRARCRRMVTLALGVLVSAACIGSPQEDLPPDEVCKDVGYALSNRVLDCTGDYDAAVQAGRSFDDDFDCRVKKVDDRIEYYYSCPVEVRALDCATVRRAAGDLESLVAAIPMCRLILERSDGSPIPAPPLADGGTP